MWTEDGYRLELHRVLRKAEGYNPGKTTHEIISELSNSESSKLAEALASQVKEESKPKIRPPILINHGLLSSSADWVLLGPQKALGKYLEKNFMDSKNKI